MGGRQFDGLAVWLAARPARRGALRLLTGGAVAALLVGARSSGAVAGACKVVRARCRRDGRCCSGRCSKQGRCCIPAGQPPLNPGCNSPTGCCTRACGLRTAACPGAGDVVCCVNDGGRCRTPCECCIGFVCDHGRCRREPGSDVSAPGDWSAVGGDHWRPTTTDAFTRPALGADPLPARGGATSAP